jgi:hypothetical protein
MTCFQKLLLPLAAGVALAVAPLTRAADDQDLAAKVKRLEAEVEALKTAQAKGPAQAKPADAKPAESVADRVDLLEVKQGDAVVKGDIPGSFRIPGSEISIRPYGYAELNWIHVFNNDNTANDYSTFAPYLPLKGSGEAKLGGRDYFTARESRLGIEAGMPTKYGILAMKIEGDFNNEPRTGNSAVYGAPANIFTQQVTNSYGFRLRHAYGSFGGLLVGQTWSTFMDVDNFPETVDYNGPVGATFIRQPQIRYAYATAKAGTFTAALENSVTYVLNGADGSVLNASASRMPDLVVRWDKGFELGALSLRAMTQELRLKGGGLDATKRGFGVAASGLVKTRGNDFLTWGVTYGTGIGRYLNYVEGAAYDPADDEIKLETAIGGYLGYQLKPSDKLRFNFAGGFTYEFDTSYTDLAKANGFDGSDPDLTVAQFGVNRWVYQGHAGFFYTPVPATDFGLEAIYGGRQTLAKEKGQEFRINLLSRFYIN